jgi:hypothetical protein
LGTKSKDSQRGLSEPDENSTYVPVARCEVDTAMAPGSHCTAEISAAKVAPAAVEPTNLTMWSRRRMANQAKYKTTTTSMVSMALGSPASTLMAPATPRTPTHLARQGQVRSRVNFTSARRINGIQLIPATRPKWTN